MGKLEFIDKYIELLKQKIESSKESARLYYANDDWEFGEMEEENRVGYEEELELFKQIKSDLEAWEVMKSKLELKLQRSTFDCNNDNKVIHSYVYNYITLNEQENKVIKKALEVK